MKGLFFLLLLIPSLTISQSIPPKANTIVVHGVTFQEVCMRLLDSGYVIEKKDSDLQTIVTQPRKYPYKFNAGYVIYARVKDSAAVIYATYFVPYTKSLLVNLPGGNDPILKDERAVNIVDKKGRTKERDLDAIPYLQINTLALSFGKPVEYKIQ